MATHHFIESEDEKLITAAEKGHISDATKALVAGADPNCRYRGRNRHHLVNNDTPLHISARRGDVVLVKLLIVFDADLNLKNRNQETPVEVARPACREIIEKILKLRISKPEITKLQSRHPSRMMTTYLYSAWMAVEFEDWCLSRLLSSWTNDVNNCTRDQSRFCRISTGSLEIVREESQLSLSLLERAPITAARCTST